MTTILWQWLVTSCVPGIIFLFAADWLTGAGVIFSGRTMDERKRAIKQRAIVQSWLCLLIGFVANAATDQFFPVSKAEGSVNYPLLYLIAAILLYFIFLIYNNRRMSVKSKK
ncbi:MAG: hypothetical protein ABF868_06805 [Sporolactobacillus sp.]